MPAPKLSSDELQAQVVVCYDQASTNATASFKLLKVPTAKKFRIDEIKYVNPTGLATSDTNYFVIAVNKSGSASATSASWSTKTTGGQGTLAANTFVSLVKSGTDLDLVYSGDDELTLAMTLTGTLTLPAGRFEILGRYV